MRGGIDRFGGGLGGILFPSPIEEAVTDNHPDDAARLWATLPHLTRGRRAAGNVVTLLDHDQAAARP